MKNDKQLFVVPTKEAEFIFDCVASINEYHPDADILIVDSDSENKDYMKKITNYGNNVIVSNFKNKNYEFGAILHGFLNYKNDYDVFFFIQDSMLIKRNMDSSKLEEDMAWVFNAYYDGWTKWVRFHVALQEQYPDFFNHPKYICPNGKLHIQYNSFVIRTETFDKCINSEIFSLIGPPKNKFGSMNWERLWTTIFLSNDIDIKLYKDSIEKIPARRE